jgi:hypothetical protein
VVLVINISFGIQGAMDRETGTHQELFTVWSASQLEASFCYSENGS